MSSEGEDYEILPQQRARLPRRRTRLSLTRASVNPNIISVEEPSTSGINVTVSPNQDSSIILLSDNETQDSEQNSNNISRIRPNTRARLRNTQRRNTNNPIGANNSIENFRIRTPAGTAVERVLNDNNNLPSNTSATRSSPQIDEVLDMIDEIREASESAGTALNQRSAVVQALNHFFHDAYSYLNASNNYGLNNDISNNRDVNNLTGTSALIPPFHNNSESLSEFSDTVMQNEAVDDLNLSIQENGNINAVENREGQNSAETNEILVRNNEGSSYMNNLEEIRIINEIMPNASINQVEDEIINNDESPQPNLLHNSLETQLQALQRNLEQAELHLTVRIPPMHDATENLNLPSTSTGTLQTSNRMEIIEIEDTTEVIGFRHSPSPKKRRRSKTNDSAKKNAKHNFPNFNEEEDDGSTCPICLDHWDLSGPHRLSSLKCGHLFGDSCIRRWLNECPQGAKVCPSCKTKVGPRDLRFIYAKRIRTVDNSEELRLKEQVEQEKNKYTRLQTDYELLSFELKTVKAQVTKLEDDIERMSRIQNGALDRNIPGADKTKLFHLDYKMFLSKNITITQEPSCRVLIHSKQNNNLMISQKSSQSLFNGYGVKFIDVQDNFRPTNFLYTSQRPIRDLSLSANDDLISCASMETSVKIFDVRTRQSAVSLSLPTNQTIWACSFDKEYRSNTIYLGSQHGSTYIYDIRNRNQTIDEQCVEGDLSPVIQILPVPMSTMFPYGGFWVCKLQSLWFYEIQSTQALNATRIGIEGPFMSINYDAISGNMLISTRNCTKFPMSKYILGKIMKVNNSIIWDTEMHLFGSKITPVMTRCTQISLPDNNTLIAAYIQDAKQLTLWNVGECSKIQSLACSDTVYDTCPINISDKIYMAASTDMKCRIYEVVSSEKH